MAKYQVTIELTTRLSREVEADSAQDAEPLADQMLMVFLQGENTYVVGTEHHRSVEMVSGEQSGRFRPLGR